MLEFFLAGFTGSFFSYFITVEICECIRMLLQPDPHTIQLQLINHNLNEMRKSLDKIPTSHPI